MQINGAQLTSLFSPKLQALQDNTRKPVTIDVKASLELNDPPSYSALTLGTQIKSSSQVSSQTNDLQQAQFVRFFSVNDFAHSSTNQDSRSQVLPQGVQHYLKVEAMSLESQQRFVNERV